MVLLLSGDRLGWSSLLTWPAEAQHRLTAYPRQVLCTFMHTTAECVHSGRLAPQDSVPPVRCVLLFFRPRGEALNKPAHLSQILEVEPFTLLSQSLHLLGEEVGSFSLLFVNFLLLNRPSRVS